jgi:hypothetical protein
VVPSIGIVGNLIFNLLCFIGLVQDCDPGVLVLGFGRVGFGVGLVTGDFSPSTFLEVILYPALAAFLNTREIGSNLIQGFFFGHGGDEHF